MIGMIIWSRARPAQLDLLLNSCVRYCPNQFEVNVIYKADEEYKSGYELCKSYHPSVRFLDEDFEGSSLSSLTKTVLGMYNWCCVSTDDSCFYRSFKIEEKDLVGIDIFSGRLGFNTKIQNPFDGSVQPALTKYTDEGNTILWDSRLHHPHSNYGYQYGLDSHIYSKRVINIIQEAKFNTVNQLESWLFYNAKNKANPYIRSFKHSVAVNIPGNNTSGITQTDNSLPLNDVNEKFLSGKRFSLDNLSKVKIVGCHQLLPLIMQ